MFSNSFCPLLHCISTTSHHHHYKPLITSCNNSFAGAKSRNISFDFPARQRPIFSALNQECGYLQRVDQDWEISHVYKPISNEIHEEQIKHIKQKLSTIEGGRINVSAYDTAWVALIEEIDGSGRITPQFPACLQWIGDNQHPDGSWGATDFMFSAYEHLLNTLACVVALKKWNLHPQKIAQGMSFIKNNFWKLKDEKSDHRLVGFEIVFPSLVQLARKLDMEVPDDSDPILQDLYAKRKIKLSKIPEDILYKERTTLHFSLEGMEGLDWEKILQVQWPDGSMLYSPASTAHVFMQTKDAKSLNYLTQVVKKFNGGVPFSYPNDIFARLWAVDRLQRLGISRYFQPEINQCVDYVSRYWTDQYGLYAASNSPFHDIDDTAMGFRILRSHGHEVSPDAFLNFKHGDAFCCFPRQTSESVTAMFNFYRACQLMFPGETALMEGKEFAYKFLRERQANFQILDKFVVLKDFPGEVKYALETPWYASLPRVEARFYVDQYGGEDDLWIGKTFYMMADINNNNYLQLAKLDFNICQSLHQIEWKNMCEWYKNSKLEKFGISERSLLFSYFLAAASIFEPERSTERLAWAKSSILVQLVESFFNKEATSYDQRKAFMYEFARRKDLQNAHTEIGEGIMGILVGTLNKIAVAAQEAHKTEGIHHYLYHAWEKWLLLWGNNNRPSEAELLVCTLNVCASGIMPGEILCNPQYKHLSELTNAICHRLHQFHKIKVDYEANKYVETDNSITVINGIESDMQELVQLVLQGTTDGLDLPTKQMFLTIAKSFYYTAYCAPEVIAIHIEKVLFHSVM